MGREKDGRPHPVDTYVGNQIRLRRTLLGMSQGDLGHALGLTFQQIQKYERGVNRVSASRLFDLSRVMNVSIPFFFGDISDDPFASGSRASSENDRLASRETLELVGAYYRITDPSVRKNVIDLIAAMGPAEP
jgi:transcriptional regulator with XRE-family HTH domain